MAQRASDIKPKLELKLSMDELRYISLFQDMTGVTPKDCVVSDELNVVMFIVDSDKVGQAVGRKGTNVRHLSRLIGKDVEVVGWAEDLETFVKNIFTPARVYRVQLIDGKDRRTVHVYVDPKDKGLAIGKNGRNVAKARILLNRYFSVDTVVII
uniref:Probable transcription termination protein NusA n=1 Tax=Ignisphaera aggregans TaxID=334771 RepID=A0A7C2ZNX4_9CREN